MIVKHLADKMKLAKGAASQPGVKKRLLELFKKHRMSIVFKATGPRQDYNIAMPKMLFT
jgi:hypothetical protein